MLYRAFGYDPRPDISTSFWCEIAGTQAQRLYDFLQQQIMSNHRLQNVPTYILDSSTVMFATTGKPIKAHIFLRCDKNEMGNFKCQDTDTRFKKRIILSPYPNNPRQIRKFLPHGTEIMRQILPMVDEVPIHIKLNVIAFTGPLELPIVPTPQPTQSNSHLDNPITKQTTAPFAIYQDPPVTTSQHNEDNSHDNKQDDQQSTGDSIQAGIIASQATGQLNVVANPGDNVPIPMDNFTPLATSTEDDKPGPTAKGKSANGKGKSSNKTQQTENSPAPPGLSNRQTSDRAGQLPLPPSFNDTPQNFQGPQPPDNQMPSTSSNPPNSPNSKQPSKKRRHSSNATPKKRRKTTKGHQKVVVLDPRTINKRSLQTSLDKYFTRRSRILRIKRSLSRKSSKTQSASRSNSSTNNNISPTEPSLNISPILPPSNITINLPDTPQSILANISNNLTLNTQEPDSLIVVTPDNLVRVNTNDVSASSSQASVKIIYDSGTLSVEMPAIPNPAWRINPNPPRSDPPHVIIEIDNSSKITRRLVLKTEYDPFQLAEAALHGNLVDLTSEANEDDVIVVSDDDELTIQPIPFPDPVPAISNIPDLIPVSDDDDILFSPNKTSPTNNPIASTSARIRSKSAPQANQPQKKRALYKLRDFHIQLVDFRRYLRKPDGQHMLNATDFNLLNRNIQRPTPTSNRSRAYPDILHNFPTQQEEQDIIPGDESHNSSTLSQDPHQDSSDSFGTGSDKALPKSTSTTASRPSNATTSDPPSSSYNRVSSTDDSHTPPVPNESSLSNSAPSSDNKSSSQEDKADSNQSQFSSGLPEERTKGGSRGGHASAGDASYPQ